MAIANEFSSSNEIRVPVDGYPILLKLSNAASTDNVKPSVTCVENAIHFTCGYYGNGTSTSNTVVLRFVALVDGCKIDGWELEKGKLYWITRYKSGSNYLTCLNSEDGIKQIDNSANASKTFSFLF